MSATVASPMTFDNTYGRLPERFFARVEPARVARPGLLCLNAPLAAALGIDLDAMDRDAWAEVFAGNRLLPGSEPLAMAYAGHQFGHFVPQLGDGRAVLLGEVIDRSGVRRDIQLKGAGQTPFSRQGDGRAALGPVLREYLVSEAMHALGVRTTRALAAVTTGETVLRETTLPGAVLTRVAESHIRVGTFQYFAMRGDFDAVRELADYAIERHYPDARDARSPYLALLEAVADRQARLVSRWMHLGFIHGVMNTDNMAISGETVDYGPCAFLDRYDPAKAYSAVDQFGRYAFGNQPGIAQWNLARLAETLLPLIDDDEARALTSARELIEAFPHAFRSRWLAGMRRKLGLFTSDDGDLALVDALLEAMRDNGADFTLFFRRLCDAAGEPAAHEDVRRLFDDPSAYDRWAARWQERMGLEPQPPGQRAAAMRQANPAFIPRNHHVERALNAAVLDGDLTAFHGLRAVLAHPYEDQPDSAGYGLPPTPEEEIRNTFCGT